VCIGRTPARYIKFPRLRYFISTVFTRHTQYDDHVRTVKFISRPLATKTNPFQFPRPFIITAWCQITVPVIESYTRRGRRHKAFDFVYANDIRDRYDRRTFRNVNDLCRVFARSLASIPAEINIGRRFHNKRTIKAWATRI